LTVFNGNGGEYAARIEALGRDEVTLSIGAFEPAERESPLQLTLIQGIARGERMDTIVQKATELGVARIVPLAAERSVVRLSAGAAERRAAHWQAVAIAACEQCGRNRVPQVGAPVTLPAALTALPPQGARVTLSPSADLPLSELPAESAVTLLIGPEGGLTAGETDLAAHAGFVARRLGPRVLRTETASLVALAVLQAGRGDLSR
jgi:16S rRNA (uracil1498-N3)-methyltransferase